MKNFIIFFIILNAVTPQLNTHGQDSLSMEKALEDQGNATELIKAFAEDHKKAIEWFDTQSFPRPMRGDPKEANWFWDMSTIAFDKQLWKEAWGGFHYTYELFTNQQNETERTRCLERLEVVYKRMGRNELSQSCIAERMSNSSKIGDEKAALELPSPAGEIPQEKGVGAKGILVLGRVLNTWNSPITDLNIQLAELRVIDGELNLVWTMKTNDLKSKTDQSGRFKFENVPIGTFAVADPWGYELVDANGVYVSITVETGGPKTINLGNIILKQ